MLQVKILFKKHYRYILPVLTIFILTAFYLKANYNSEVEFQKEQARKIQEIVKIGMDIDIAISLLKNNGFDVGNKHRPTGKGNHFIVHVKLFKELTAIDSIAETFGLPWSIGQGYVAVEAKDNIVYNIVRPQ